MERVGGRKEKNGRTLFGRPKPTVGCNANGRRRRIVYCHSGMNKVTRLINLLAIQFIYIKLKEHWKYRAVYSEIV